ncbi:MAG: hypothetical protein M3Y77_00105 [Actinomycetota bacterium]|nr:hypothetical protein [Actinomycetota bacterium]
MITAFSGGPALLPLTFDAGASDGHHTLHVSGVAGGSIPHGLVTTFLDVQPNNGLRGGFRAFNQDSAAIQPTCTATDCHFEFDLSAGITAAQLKFLIGSQARNNSELLLTLDGDTENSVTIAFHLSSAINAITLTGADKKTPIQLSAGHSLDTAELIVSPAPGVGTTSLTDLGPITLPRLSMGLLLTPGQGSLCKIVGDDLTCQHLVGSVFDYGQFAVTALPDAHHPTVPVTVPDPQQDSGLRVITMPIEVQPLDPGSPVDMTGQLEANSTGSLMSCTNIGCLTTRGNGSIAVEGATPVWAEFSFVIADHGKVLDVKLFDSIKLTINGFPVQLTNPVVVKDGNSFSAILDLTRLHQGANVVTVQEQGINVSIGTTTPVAGWSLIAASTDTTWTAPGTLRTIEVLPPRQVARDKNDARLVQIAGPPDVGYVNDRTRALVFWSMPKPSPSSPNGAYCSRAEDCPPYVTRDAHIRVDSTGEWLSTPPPSAGPVMVGPTLIQQRLGK